MKKQSSRLIGREDFVFWSVRGFNVESSCGRKHLIYQINLGDLRSSFLKADAKMNSTVGGVSALRISSRSASGIKVSTKPDPVQILTLPSRCEIKGVQLILHALFFPKRPGENRLIGTWPAPHAHASLGKK